ncbi:hypothetical protein AB4Z34_14995 [Ensifer sp. 2YAB10]|jgi:hypothetical protein|uniref:hypothetical protein n=1 Tax=Ensifer TaxID=106591 RepID=UPI000DE40BE0|nr:MULTISPECIES: hypothetical protein [Ensifer]MBK5570595.1 hypothetical protein [Ensifer sp. SSB1]MBZ7921319.1 hypothetical protein [Ensifer adhaerens]UAX93750.1 hypothetical protein LAC78_05900 [Ensifer adhaerens]UAY01386.1 hypothetical protein LAC80_05905 [Ensifer adhaerens]UAY08768.1 hypothetical protein LAC81_05905 [Ensifer adhaerens]
MRACSRIFLRTGLAILIAGAAAGSVLAEDATQAFESFPSIAGPRKMPKLTGFSPMTSDPIADGTLKDVKLEALLTEKGAPVEAGLTWRVFSPIPGSDGKLPLLATSEGGSTAFNVVPGDYFVNVSFGRASATRKIRVPQEGTLEKQVLVLDAGGIKLNAVSGSDVRIPPAELSFSVYSADTKSDGERALIMSDVKPNTVIRLGAGTYHVTSSYGATNASTAADIQVEAGKLTEATIQHRAAKLTLKLVSEPGGEAIANTAWTILTSAGDTVDEENGAFPTLVLLEGSYSAVARYKDKIYERDFTVKAGVNTDVEVLLSSGGNDANTNPGVVSDAQD